MDMQQTSDVVAPVKAEDDKIEWKLYLFLLGNKGRTVSNAAIHDHLYPTGNYPKSNVVQVLIRRIRNKGVNITTFRGRGYQLESEAVQ